MIGDNRGQAYTLEGIIGAIIIASALVVGIQAVNVTPWTGSGSAEAAELSAQGGDALELADDRDALRTAVTCLGPGTSPTPHPGVLSTDPAVTDLGRTLNSTGVGVSGVSQGANYAMYVVYQDSNGEINQTQIGPGGTPTGTSATIAKEFVLLDDDPVYSLREDSNGEVRCVDTGETLSEKDDDDEIYLDDQDDSSEIFAVVQLRVIAW